jgi:hypothetical protein
MLYTHCWLQLDGYVILHTQQHGHSRSAGAAAGSWCCCATAAAVAVDGSSASDGWPQQTAALTNTQ